MVVWWCGVCVKERERRRQEGKRWKTDVGGDGERGGEGRKRFKPPKIVRDGYFVLPGGVAATNLAFLSFDQNTERLSVNNASLPDEKPAT